MSELDTRLLADGPVVLVSDAGAAARWLAAHGYRVSAVPAGNCRTAAELHVALAELMRFPSHYGQNLDALNDALRSYALTGPPRLALVLDRYDAFAACDRATAQAVLDLFAGQARLGLLHGRRMLCLVQSDDPALAFEPVGASPVTWHG